MDIVFTLVVWIVLAVLVPSGLRMAQRRYDETHAGVFTANPGPRPS